MKSSKFTGQMEKIKAKWTQASLKYVLKVKDPNLSRVLIVQNNVYAAVHGAIGGDSLEETCSFLLGNYHTVILTNSYSCSRRLGWLLTLPVPLLNFFPLKFAAAQPSDKFAKRATWRVFFGFIFVACWIRT